MTTNNANAKKKNYRFEIKSHAKELLTKYYKENYEVEGKQLSDMYEEIAEYCGISPSTVGQIRLKNLQPSYIVSVRLSKFLGLEPTDVWEVVEMEDYDKTHLEECRVFGCDRVATTRGYCMKHIYHSKVDIEKERATN